MGTRHLICIFWKGKWVIAQYGQWDGYPEGQGVKLFRFLSVARNIENLKAGLEHVYEPTEEEHAAIWVECEARDNQRRAQEGARYDPTISSVRQLYPSLSRDTSAGLLGIISRAGRSEEEDGAEDAAEQKPKKIPVSLELGFANHTLFCEWAYVIDLDKEVLEVYGGGERKHDGHRFKDVGGEQDPVPAFICSFDFSELYLMKSDTEFLAKVMKALDEKRKDEGGYDEDGNELLDLGVKKAKDEHGEGSEEEDHDENDEADAHSAKGSP